MPQPNGSWRTAPLPPGWRHSTRTRILTRDNHQCQKPVPAGGICKAHANQVDHIIPAYLGGPDTDDNYWSLCERHHRSKTGSEGGHAAAAKRIPRKRPTEQHPGMIT